MDLTRRTLTYTRHTRSAPTSGIIYLEMGFDLDTLIFVMETSTPLAKAVPPPVGGPLEGAMDAATKILKYAKVRSDLTP